MAYRFYVIDALRCRSIPVDSECATDTDAMIYAGKLMVPDCSVEIWDGCRFVGQFGQHFSRWASAR